MPAEASSLRLLYGTDEPLPERLDLRAGPLALSHVAGALRRLRHGPDEVWHAVTFPFRDPDWWTPPFRMSSLAHAAQADSFTLECSGAFDVSPAIAGRLTVAGDPDGSLRIQAEAVPAGDVLANRIGLCVLLPIALAGAACEVEHDDGRTSRSTFPVLVPPWPPFMNVRAIRHAYAPGRWASCRFTGDSFEFEDQRNNADASFKIYSRSNMMPRPYRLRGGVPIRQAVDLRLERGVASGWNGASPATAVGGAGRDAPRLGLAASRSDTGADLLEVAAALRPDFLHLTLDATAIAAVEPSLVEAVRASGRPLRLDLALPDRDDAAGRCAEVAALFRHVPLDGIAVFPSASRAVQAARARWPDVRIAGGTPHFFAQINRLEELGPVDALTFTVSPLVHGADDESVMASPQSLPGLAATLAHRHPGRAVWVGPSALAMRASPLGRLPAQTRPCRMAMARDDPRARGLFGAAWALAMAAQAAAAGVEALTLMAVDGPSGVAARSEEGLRFHPVAAVLARLAGGGAVIESPVAAGPALAVLAVRRRGGRELFLANPTESPVSVELAGWAAEASCAVLDETALREGAGRPGPPSFAPRTPSAKLPLTAYAVAHLTGAGEPL